MVIALHAGKGGGATIRWGKFGLAKTGRQHALRDGRGQVLLSDADPVLLPQRADLIKRRLHQVDTGIDQGCTAVHRFQQLLHGDIAPPREQRLGVGRVVLGERARGPHRYQPRADPIRRQGLLQQRDRMLEQPGGTTQVVVRDLAFDPLPHQPEALGGMRQGQLAIR